MPELFGEASLELRGVNMEVCCDFGGWFVDADGCSLSVEFGGSFCCEFADGDEDILTGFVGMEIE
jgi:hypothetical protein